MKTALYRHFDAAGRLLYVGISLCAVGRLAQHRHKADWFSKIERVDIEWLPTREAALTAEAIAIAREAPIFNRHRPAVPEGFGVPAPEWQFDSWEHNEVRLQGEPLDELIWQGVQWSATEYGVECRDGTYCIEADRLMESHGRNGKVSSWPEHMRNKDWVNMPDFIRAMTYALGVHCGMSLQQLKPREWIVAHVLSGALDGFYSTDDMPLQIMRELRDEYPGERFIILGIPGPLLGWAAVTSFGSERRQHLSDSTSRYWLGQERSTCHGLRARAGAAQ